MATTVAQHSVATFTSPVNGTTPIDANTVRGNDNTTRAAYNDHDADPGIHVQSSTLASRPVAGTAGRKWITEDSGVYTLWFDDGTNWHPVSSENIALTVLAGENLVKGDVVKVTGWNNGQDLPEVVKTTSASDTAFAVITATVSSGSMGYATNTGIVQDVNTAAYSVGTILYANGSGGFTSTKPTSGNYQPVAYVMRSNTNNGVYYVEFSTPRIVERSDNTASTVVLRDASGNFSAGTVSVGALTSAGLVTFASLKGTGATTVTDILNDSTMATASATTLATSASIKTYVDNKVATVDTLAEVLANGNTTGANDIIVNAGQKIRTPAVAAQDGTSAISIANSTGALTLNTALADSNLATISTAGKVSNSATTATSANTASAIVARDASGNFSAGTITAALTGNASTATALQTARNINGVAFNGTADITVTAAAGTLTGTTLASGVTASSLTSVGTLQSLTTSGNITVSASNGTVQVITPTADQPQIRMRMSGTDGILDVTRNSGTAPNLIFGTEGAEAGRFDANRNFIVDTNTLFVDAANNRVGVGTASPAVPLDVFGSQNGISNPANGTINVSDSASAALGVGGQVVFRGNYVGTTSTQFASITAYKESATVDGSQYGASLIFNTRTQGGNNTEKMRLDNAGNLGLGVTPSAWFTSLDYSAMQLRNSSLYFRTGTSELYVGNNHYYNGTNWIYVSSTDAARYDMVGGQHKWFTAPSGTAGNAITFTQAMTLDASGNLAIGTDTPGTALGRVFRINGASSGTNTGLIFSNALTDNGTAYSSNTQFVLGSLSAIPTVFVTNNAERARITSGGRFYIGATSAPAADPYFYVETSGFPAIWGKNAAAGGYTFNSDAVSNGGTYFHFNFLDAGVSHGSISSNGTNTAYNTSSDVRLKANIADADAAGTVIDAIAIRQFDWKSNNRHQRYGVIAQEVEPVFPEMVTKGQTDDDMWGVDYSTLVPLMLKEIQSLRSRVAALESN